MMHDDAPRPNGTDAARLDRTAEALCAAFGCVTIEQASWGRWSRLTDLRPGHPAFVLRAMPQGQGLGLDTQCWDIGAGEACWPTTRIVSVSLPWWRRLAERPGQRCLIPVSACTAALPARRGRGSGGEGRPTWFTLADEPVFTIAGLWRDAGEARGFAMLGCLSDGPFPIMPVIVPAASRDRWLSAPWDSVAPLLTPGVPETLRLGLPEPHPAFYADRPPAATVTGR